MSHKSLFSNHKPVLSNKPLAYQRGWAEFYKLKFKVTPDVLIPRPETELLVDEVIAFLGSDPKAKLTARHAQAQGPTLSYTILDLGTGSGCIAISLAVNLPNVKIWAADISEQALDIARKNAKFHKVEKNVIFLKSDLLENFQKAPEAVVTNLPYIPKQRLPYLDPSVIQFEPKIALDGGPDGFSLYRKLFSQMVEKKLYPKILIGEIDYTHGELARNEAQRYFPKAQIEVKTDLAKKQRILIVRFA